MLTPALCGVSVAVTGVICVLPLVVLQVPVFWLDTDGTDCMLLLVSER